MLADAASLPRPGRSARGGLWALPLLLSGLFVAGVIAWSWRNDRSDREAARSTLISDALSAEAQLRGRLDIENAHLRALAAAMARAPRGMGALQHHPEVDAGLRRLWLSLTWLDDNNRIVAQVPDASAGGGGSGVLADDGGLSAHLVAAVSEHPAPNGLGTPDNPEANRFDIAGEKLVLRFSPTVLLKRWTPWWLLQRYELRLVDASDQVIAAVDDDSWRGAADHAQSYRVLVGNGMPGAWLELSPRQPLPPWWQTLPLGLIGGFLALAVVATVLLRRQMHQVQRAESAWRTEAAWRGAMEDSALVALRARDMEGRLLYVNRTFCEMVGRSAESLLGLAPPFPYWPPDAVEAAMERSQRNLAGLAPREGYETRWCHASGQLIDVMIFESPLVDAGGRQIGWMGSIIDITARKRLEERERHQAEAMTQQARLTTLGEVASALAHQLNQPLTAIAGYNAGVLRLLQRQPAADPAIVQALQRLGEQAAEAGRIVQRIRGFLTRRSPQRERTDLLACARHAVALLQRELGRQGITLEWAVPEALPDVCADAVLVEQVFINLVRNAADEMSGRPVRRVRIAIGAAGERFLRVDVDDSGPGLQGRDAESLTAPFYSTKADGMGMGLAICRSVIEAHHGHMDACASPLLPGARFSFTLPLHDPLEPPHE